MTALILLSHESAARVNRMVERWRDRTGPATIVVAYGGPREEFAGIEARKVFVDDPRLRTRDHQRELQSYTRVLALTVDAIAADDNWNAVYLAEYDMAPVVADLWERLDDLAAREDADLLGYRAWRIDDTLHPHYRSHLLRTGWLEWLASVSVRSDPSVILSCLGCGQRWRREALEEVLTLGEPVPAYLELHLPSLAHHLGFRVRGMGGQDLFVKTRPLAYPEHERAVMDGAWVTHPVRDLWSASGSNFPRDPQ